MSRVETLQGLRPTSAPRLRFGHAEVWEAYDALGANCGPGALAGLCGLTPREAVALLPGFPFHGGTTEWMLYAALETLGLSWAKAGPCPPRYGIARIQWDGPWIGDPDIYAKLGHSHWVGMAREGTELRVFDFNAISFGGWMTAADWARDLVPWLLAEAEPEATGPWWISETLEILTPMAGR